MIYTLYFESEDIVDRYQCATANERMAVDDFLYFVFEECAGSDWLYRNASKYVVCCEDESGNVSRFAYLMDYNPCFHVHKMGGKTPEEIQAAKAALAVMFATEGFGVHFGHCFLDDPEGIGEYEGCKYGDEYCPADPLWKAEQLEIQKENTPVEK